MNILKSYTEYAVTTPTTDFVIGFDFNYGTDAVNVTVDGVPATDAGYSVIYLNSTTVQLSPAVPSGVVRLQRETDIDAPDNQFTAGAKFIASNVDENFTQIRHSQQEVRDGFEKLSDDTYEILDTLQVVGQAAQDAADAAEQAAQTANDAAAQVDDKVSYQDLPDAIAATPHNTLQGRDVVGAHPASSILDTSGENQQQINDKTPAFCDTVAQLRTLPPRIDGAVMFVKSHSNNGSGGVVYTWDANSVALDDNGWIIKSDLSNNGRWVADFGNAPITPRHFGAIGDGSVDERLICEKSIVAASKTSGHWLVPFGDTYLLNSYATYSEIANFAAGMLPVLPDMKYEIQGTLQVGGYFDDRAFLVFTDVNGSVGNFTPVRNWKMFGTGDIDLSLSGKRRTVFNSRIPIYLETSYDASIETIKIHSGDIPNAIVTGGENITIDGVRFVNLMQDNSANDDHSSIYAKARGTHIKNCYFKMSSINGNLNACPIELHNSDSSFKDSVIDGYRNTHILAAITVEFPYIENLEVSGLKAKVHRNFANLDVWTGSVISNVKVHDNECGMLPFPSDEAITAAGLTPAYTVAAQAMLHVTNDSALGYDLQAGVGVSVQYYDNTYISHADTQIPDNLRAAVYFHKAPISGISVFRNNIRAKNIILASPELDATDKRKLDRFVFTDNDFDETFLGADNLIKLNLVSLQSSSFDLKFKREFYCNNLINISVSDTTLSIANAFIVHPQNTGQITKCVNVTTDVLQNPSNRISYPETVAIYFGGESPTVSDFFRAGVKTARILDRLNVPATVHLSDYIGNVADSRLTAICMNPDLLFGTYNARLLLEN